MSVGGPGWLETESLLERGDEGTLSRTVVESKPLVGAIMGEGFLGE